MSDKVKDAELLKSAVLMGSVTLAKEVELITVKTISPKVVDQMRWFDTDIDRGSPTDSSVDYAKLEIIGLSERSYQIIVRDENGTLGRIRVLNYLSYLRAHQHMDLETSQAVVRALPQLFEV